jgi:hypothetical protein
VTENLVPHLLGEQLQQLAAIVYILLLLLEVAHLAQLFLSLREEMALFAVTVWPTLALVELTLM